MAIAGQTDAARPSDPRPPRDLGRGPLRGPGRRRRPAGPDPARRAWTQTLHLALGAVIWALLVGLTCRELLHRPDARCVDAGSWPPAATDVRAIGGRARTRGDSVRAYIALTKPRIIELLLVTTVPAMVLATRGCRIGSGTGWLVVWTLIGGTLAAGSANAINCYLDRDIDELMTPDPAPAAARPTRSSPSGPSSSGSCSASSRSSVMAWFVNLLAAFLTLLAIALLRRRLHDAAEATRRRRTSSSAVRPGAPAGHRLGRGHRQHRRPGADPVRARLLLDAAALLGAQRCASARTTPRPACRCCPWSRASPRRPARSPSTRS